MFYQSEDRFIEDDGNCETTTITRTTYEEKCFDDNCNINHPFSKASELVDDRSLFQSGIQKSGNEATGSRWRQRESESKCETTRLDYSRYGHCLTEVSEHGNCCHNIRIVPIRKTARSPGRPSMEHIQESRSRSAGPTSRRYFKECTECSRVQQQRQYCYGAHCTQHQHKRRLSWPFEECTFPEQPVLQKHDSKVTEKNDRQELHRRHLLEQKYAPLYPPNNDRNVTKEVSEEWTNAGNDEHPRWKTATNVLSEHGFNKTSLSKHRCQCRHCQFSKGMETGHELVNACDSGGKRWRINEIKRSCHRNLGSDEYHMEKAVVDQRGQVCAVQNEFIDRSGGSRGCDTLKSEAPKSAESGIFHAEQSGASNREPVISTLRNQYSDSHSNKWDGEHPQHDTKCVKTSKNPMTVSTSTGKERNQTCFEERDVALQRSEESGHRTDTQSFALDWHDNCKKSEKIIHKYHRKTETHGTATQIKGEHAQSDTNREEAVDFWKYLDVDCCESDNTDVARNRDLKENCQLPFEQVSMLNFLQRSPEFDEDPCHVRYTLDRSENAEENKKIQWFNHRMDDRDNTCFDGKTNVLISNENLAQAQGALKHTGYDAHMISGCESSDRDLTVAFVEPSQMPSRAHLLQQTDAITRDVGHSFSEFKQMSLDRMTPSADLNSGDEQVLDVQQLSERCRANDAAQQTTFGINSRTDRVEWYNSEAAQEHSDTARQISDEKKVKIIYKMNTSLQGKKASTNSRPRGQSAGRCQNENCPEVTFQNDGNKDSEKTEDCQETVKRQKHHQRNVVDEYSEHSGQSSQSYQDNSDLRQSSSYVRDRSRRNATEVRSATDSSNSNAIDRSGMSGDEEVSHVSEVHDAPNTGNVAYRRLVAPLEHENFTSGSAFKIVAVDFNIQRNALAHHTDRYEVVSVRPYRLVCRRGQSVTIFLKANDTYDPHEDTVIIIFLNEAAGRRVEVAVTNDSYLFEEARKDDWAARILRQSSSFLTVDVFIPYNCAIGIWEMVIECRRFGSRTSIVEVDAPIYVLFNPWNTEDETFYPAQYELNEYVLDPIGILFKMRSKDRWLYGQFENVCLFATIELIQRLVKENILNTNSLASAADIARALTFGINQYVLEASWQKLDVNDLGPYDVLPSLWTGSTEILMHYLKAGKRVGFGQCWCYGGLLASLCRCIGIPCRTVTNYESAHDTNEDLTITLNYIDGKPSRDNRDSIWNFHVWNEVWMRRDGLKKSYNGWQVCDATHQQISSESGRYQCGPFPVRALLHGELRLPYDGPFIYGEINADVIDRFYRTDPLSRRPIFVSEVKSTESVGIKIVTNNPKMIEFAMDITSNYKEPEGSRAEREQHQRALESIGLRPIKYRRAAKEFIETKMDVKFFIGEFRDIEIGKPINGFVEVTNQSDSHRTVFSQVQVDVVCYTGMEVANVYTAHEVLKMERSQVQRIEIEVPAESYSGSLADDLDIAITVFATVEETGQRYHHREIMKIQKPKLTIEAKPVFALNKEESVKIQLVNPFDIALSECELKIDGTGFQFDDMPIRCSLIDAHGTMIVNTSAVSKRRGLNQLIAVFSCAQLKNVRATAAIRTT